MIHVYHRKRLPRLTDDARRPALALLAAGVLAACGVLVATALVRAQTDEEPSRYTPSTRGPRASYGTEQVERWRDMVAAYDWDVETALLVIACESEGNPLARNPTSDARGLWQLLGWEHLAYRLHGVWSVMNPYVATDVAYALWLAGGRRFGTRIGWISSMGCWS